MPLPDNDFARRALLPAGLRDMLPEEAESQEALAARLMGCFSQWGYRRVDPPLVEYEDSLLADASPRSLVRKSFRLLDPVSQKMMGVRADITPQIARIAVTRLHNEPRPLRLRYLGDCLRVQAEQLRPERQMLQAGAELIGDESVAAELEAATLAVAGLRALGVTGLTVDLSVSPLIRMIFEAQNVDPERAAALRAALARRDAEAVAALADPTSAALLIGLLQAAGPAETALARLDALDLPVAALALRDRLAALAAALAITPGVDDVTIDPVECIDDDYYSGVSFALFSRSPVSSGVKGQLGCGGRYLAGWGERREPAVGFSLYLDAVARVAPIPAAPRRLFLPWGVAADAARWRDDGWIVVAGLAPTADPRAEARRLGCGWVALTGAPEQLEQSEQLEQVDQGQ